MAEIKVGLEFLADGSQAVEAAKSVAGAVEQASVRIKSTTLDKTQQVLALQDREIAHQSRLGEISAQQHKASLDKQLGMTEDAVRTEIKLRMGAVDAAKSVANAVEQANERIKTTTLDKTQQILALQDREVAQQFRLGEISVQQYKAYLDKRLAMTENTARMETKLRMEAVKLADVSQERGLNNISMAASVATSQLGQLSPAARMAGQGLGIVSQMAEAAANKMGLAKIAMIGLAGTIGLLVVAYQTLVRAMDEHIRKEEEGTKKHIDEQKKLSDARLRLIEEEYKKGVITREQYLEILHEKLENAIEKEAAIRYKHLHDNLAAAKKAYEEELALQRERIESGIGLYIGAEERLSNLKRDVAAAEKSLADAVASFKAARESRYYGEAAAIADKIDALNKAVAEKAVSTEAQKVDEIAKQMMDLHNKRMEMWINEVTLEQRKQEWIRQLTTDEYTLKAEKLREEYELAKQFIEAEIADAAQKTAAKEALDARYMKSREALDARYRRALIAQTNQEIILAEVKAKVKSGLDKAYGDFSLRIQSALIEGNKVGIAHMVADTLRALGAQWIMEGTAGVLRGIIEGNPAKIAAGVKLAALGGGAVITGTGMAAAQRRDTAMPTLELPPIGTGKTAEEKPISRSPVGPVGGESVSRGQTIINYTSILRVEGNIFGLDNLRELIDGWNIDNMRALGRA